jgi:hypothetical protein
MNTKQAMAAVELIKLAYGAVAERGKEGMPSGHLYALMMPAFENVEQYNSMIALMERTQLLTKTGHVLVAAKV